MHFTPRHPRAAARDPAPSFHASVTPDALDRAREALAARLPAVPRVQLILGSGLSPLADAVPDPVVIPFVLLAAGFSAPASC